MKTFLLALVLAAAANAQSKINLSFPFLTLPEPVMHVETINLVACPTPATLPCTAVPAGTTGTYTYTLAASPIASMGAVIYFSSSQFGGDVTAFAPGVQSTITFTLPVYPSFPSPAPYTTADVITVAYWSTR